MATEQIPGVNESIYAGFGSRLGSLLLDFLFFLPIIFLTAYLNSLSLYFHFLTLIPNILIGIWYHIFLVKKYGGTPGKLITGIKIVKINAEEIGWKEAILRHSVLLMLGIFGTVVMLIAYLNADASYYVTLSWIEKQKYIASLSPLFPIVNWANNIWVWSELVVLLTNSRRRALHDYIAGTVVIKKKFHEQIIEFMKNPQVESDSRISLDSHIPIAAESSKAPLILYFLALLSFIPFIGVIVGIVFIVIGIASYKNKILPIIGFLGILFSILFFWFMYNKTQQLIKEPAMREGLAQLTQMQINNLVKDIEYYKLQNGDYPKNLDEIVKQNSLAPVTDPIYGLEGKSKNFNYTQEGKKYCLFSSGLDEIPNTKDDIYPQGDTCKNGFIIKPK